MEARQNDNFIPVVLISLYTVTPLCLCLPWNFFLNYPIHLWVFQGSKVLLKYSPAQKLGLRCLRKLLNYKKKLWDSL